MFIKMPVETSFPEVLPYSRNGSPSLVATFERPRDVCKLLGYRFYNPGIGRFTQMDPLGVEIPGIHYFYANENPIVNTDPDGLRVVTPSSSSPRGEIWNAAMRKYRIGMFLQNLSAGFTPNILSGFLPGHPDAPSKIFHTSCKNDKPIITEFPGAIDKIKNIFRKDADKVIRCMYAHEGKHASQCKCWGSAAYNKIENFGSGAFNSPFSDAAKMEVEALGVEFECLDGGDVQQYLNAYSSATHCK